MLRPARSPPPPHLQLDGGWPGPCSPPRSAPPRSHSFPPPPLDGRAARLVPPRFSRHEPGKGDEPGKKPLAAIGAPLRFRPCFPTPPHAPSQPERPPSFIRAPGGSGGHPGRGGTAGGAASERSHCPRGGGVGGRALFARGFRGCRRRTPNCCVPCEPRGPPSPRRGPLAAVLTGSVRNVQQGKLSWEFPSEALTGGDPFPDWKKGERSPAGPAPPAPAAERLLQSPTAGKQPASHQSHCLLAGWKDAAGGAS